MNAAEEICDPRFNPFGQLLTLLDSKELRNLSARAAKNHLYGLAQVLEDEINERQQPAVYPSL
jgi:hypothetical protein